MKDFRLRAKIQYSIDNGKTWFFLNNSCYVELTNTTATFEFEDIEISVKGIVIKK